LSHQVSVSILTDVMNTNMTSILRDNRCRAPSNNLIKKSRKLGLSITSVRSF